MSENEKSSDSFSSFSFEYFLLNICEKYSLSKKDVLTDWKIFLEQIDDNTDKKNIKNVEQIKQVKEEVKEEEKKCIYMFVRGKNKGNCCNGKTKKDSYYCVKHVKYDKIEKTENEEKQKKNETKEGEEKDHPRKKRIAIQRDPYTNKFVHLTTQLVFFSKQEPVIYAKLIDGIELRPLTQEDIDLCKYYNFPFDQTKYSSKE